MTVRILEGDCRDVLKTLEPGSVQCCVTSPPYWGLRDYGVQGQIGLESSVFEWIEEMVAVFREVRRVLRSDGTLWLNLGDSYATGTTSSRKPTAQGKHGYWENAAVNRRINGREMGLKPKDLIGQPWRVAFALQADGWWLRQEIIWNKPNPMPESCRDRCTKAHEQVFLLSKSDRYFYDFEAMQEPVNGNAHARRPMGSGTKNNESFDEALAEVRSTRNRRSVWTIPTEAFREAHFATFPTALVEPCIAAGCPVGGMVLDPFGGAGTTGLVADRMHREAVLIELNSAYAAMARRRIEGESPLFAEVA